MRGIVTVIRALGTPSRPTTTPSGGARMRNSKSSSGERPSDANLTRRSWTAEDFAEASCHSDRMKHSVITPGKTYALIAVGLAVAIVASLAALLTQATAAAAPLFAQSADVPSIVAAGPSPRWVGAVERARQVVRAAIAEQNLPGVSVAVGANGGIVWAEGFGRCGQRHKQERC